MAGDHWAAAGLRHVADQEAGPAVEGARVARQSLEIVEQPRMTPIAVTRKPHHLPIGPIDGKRDATSQATLGVRADGTSREWGWCRDRPEQHLGGWHFWRRRLDGSLGGIGWGSWRHRRRLGRLDFLGRDRSAKQQ